MLGTTQRYFESVAGIPRESFGNIHTFDVEECQVQATINGEQVTAMRLELTPKCQAELSSFIHDYAPRAPTFPFGLFEEPLTFGEFDKAAGAMRYFANCLSRCGNAYDPSVYAYWEGPRAADFMEVMLETVLVGDEAIDAANVWQEHMAQAMGEDYIMNTRFNCDGRFDSVANQAFKDVPVTAVSIGRGLRTPGC
tara:strand:+ start:13598 stop:14182 length:585 start_codon:yes stop_codon:yes gene_type:complete